ncbi:MAG: hypothetical protein LEGION0403_FIIPPAGN_02505 [Legionella sp.]|uniref:DUF7168 domain-containing protein n=1 Tax=Legionella sp. TaxID=459 RepID=UPI003D126582
MANKKRTLSAQDVLPCHAYFQRAIQNQQFRNDLQEASRTQAIDEFLKINIDAIDEETITRLQTWIDAFVDATTWRLCYRALNQKKYLAKNKPKNLSISNEAYAALKQYARQQNMSLSEAIIQLLENHQEPTDQERTSTPAPIINPILSAPEFISSLNKSTPEKTSHAVSLFAEEELRLWDDEVDDALWGRAPHWPRKSDNYDFKRNEAYKKYRKYLSQLTVTKPDDALFTYFSHTLNEALTPENCHHVGAHLLAIQHEALKQNQFARRFNSELFAVSKGFYIANLTMDHYADELLLFLRLIFGCTTASITSGNRTPFVFAGPPNQVLMAYQTYQYLDAFLSKEVKRFEDACHKNTKRKNRRAKAQRHGRRLVSAMFHSILDDEEPFKLMEDDEYDQLSSHSFKRVHVYYDENEPLGGWRTPDKELFRW